MNSIELVDEPKRDQVGKAVRPKQAPAETLRLYIKDGSRYSLRMESSDYEAVMKQAAKHNDKGTDILVNEKGNPLVVHARSNLYNEVDVGRVIKPGLKRGPGEIVLDSFYTKLPLEERQRDPAAPALAEAPPPPTGQAPGKVPGPAVASPAVAPKPGVSEPDPAAERKVILKKTGYELPEHLRDAYKVKSGRFYDKVTAAVRFEDHGQKLSTSIEDRAVVAHMLDVAAAKNWGHVELTGTTTFKQMAWMEAAARGMQTTGYEPTQQDLQQLEQHKRVRENAGPITIAQDKAKDQQQNNVEFVKGRDISGPNPAGGAAGASGEGEPKVLKSEAGFHAQDVERTETPAVSNSHGQPIVGRLLEHGSARYNHDPAEMPSYFVKLETQSGERTVWGKDLARAMAEGAFRQGDAIALERKGEKPVTVAANVRDGEGKVVGTEEIGAHRNEWVATHASGLVVTRHLAANDQVRVDAAARVLDKELQKYPEPLRREILNRVGRAIDKGDVTLPMPQVTERGAASAPVQQPDIDRSR